MIIYRVGQRMVLAINAVAPATGSNEMIAGSAAMHPIASSTNTIAARVNASDTKFNLMKLRFSGSL